MIPLKKKRKARHTQNRILVFVDKDIVVTCACCDSVLIIDRVSGKLVECRKPLVEESSGDRLVDAFKKSKQDRDTRNAIFDNMSDLADNKKKVAEELFKASLEEAKKDPEDKPQSIYDVE